MKLLQKCYAALIAGVILPSAVTANADVIMESDFSPVDQWKISGFAAKGTRLNENQTFVLKFSYERKIEGNHPYIEVYKDVSLDAMPERIEFDVQTEGSHLLCVQMIDKNGEHFETHLGGIDSKKVHINMIPGRGGYSAYWGGDKNKKMDLPIRRIVLKLRRSSDADNGNGGIARFSNLKIHGNWNIPQKQNLAVLSVKSVSGVDIRKKDLKQYDLSAPAVLDQNSSFQDGTPLKSPEDLSGKLYANCDEENLYLIGIVTDQNISCPHQGAFSYQNDGFELFFDVENKAYIDFQLAINPMTETGTGNVFGYRSDALGYLLAASEMVSFRTENGYALILRIPFESIPKFKKQEYMGFEFSLCDNDNNGESFRRIFWQTNNAGPVQNFGLLLFPWAKADYQKRAAAQRTVKKDNVAVKYKGAPKDLSSEIISGQASKFNKVEGRVKFKAEYENPFNYNDISMTVHITTPDGKEVVIDGFYMELLRELMYGYKKLEKAEWRWRYTPCTPGTYRYHIEVKDSRSRTAKSQEYTFSVADSKEKGFLRVSKFDSHYLRFDDGSFFFGIGYPNMTWTDKGIDEWNKHHMSQLMAFRCNYTSVNFGGMWNTGLTLEDSYSIDHAPMRYSMLNAARIDKLLELCKKRGIYVMPCLFQTQWGLSMHWNGNAYKKFCKDSTEIFTNPEVDRLLRNRYRYTMARYGYSTNILAWELFNEIEFTQGYLKDRKAAMKYIENMADYLREIDPNKHLVTVSCTMDGQVQNSNLDAVIVHPYGRDTADIIMSSLAATYPANKPTIGGESGISYPDARDADLFDKEGISLHNSLYASLFGGAGGTILHWWFNLYLDIIDRYDHYVKFHDYIEGLELDKEGFVLKRGMVNGNQKNTAVMIPVAKTWTQEKFLNQYMFKNGILLENTGKAAIKKEIDGDKNVNFITSENLNGLLRKSGKLELILENEKAGTLWITPSAVGREGAALTISVNGKTVQTQAYADLDGKNNPNAEEGLKAMKIALPQGKCTVVIGNTGKTWCMIGSIRIDGTVAQNINQQLRCHILQGRTNTLLWIQDRESTWAHAAISKIPGIQKNNSVELELPTGLYQVQFYNTWTGKFDAPQKMENKNGRLRIAIPDFHRDIAAKIIRLN